MRVKRDSISSRVTPREEEKAVGDEEDGRRLERRDAASSDGED
jgi:hypothetical protein